MDTIVYFIINAEDRFIRFISTFDSYQTTLEKSILTTKGEESAKKKSENNLYQKIDKYYSSNHVSAISTSKYFTDEINIIDLFKERITGLNGSDKLPKDYIEKSFNDFDYKYKDGESLYDTQKRMFNALNILLNVDKGKTILIFTHKYALLSLLDNYSTISYNGDFTFNDQTYFSGEINYLDTFKLTFDDKKKIKNIEYISD